MPNLICRQQLIKSEEMKNIENCFSIPFQKMKQHSEIASQRFFVQKLDSPDENDHPNVILQLCQGGLILYDNDKKPKGVILYDQELKFEMLFSDESSIRSQMIGFKIISFGKEASFFHSDELLVRKWWHLLISRITYKGFAKLFQKSMKIGQGAFSSVYLATFLFDGRRMAVKCVQKTSLDEDKLRKKSFYSQIETMRKLNHQNVNKLYGIFESQKFIYQAIELIDCGQLAYRFKSNYKFSSFQIKLIMQSLLKGLKHIHSFGIMHRDIKPQNIMFRTKSTDSEVVIVDFGLAVFCDANDYIWYRCGTPGYIAPQILNNKTYKKLQPVVDIFSVGAIFYRILFEKPLFPGKSHREILSMNTSCEFQFVEVETMSNYTTATLDLLMKMLDVNPFTRITAQEALTHPFFQQSSILKKLSVSQIYQCEQANYDICSLSSGSKDNSVIRKNFSQQKRKKYQDLRKKLLKRQSDKPSYLNHRRLKSSQIMS